MYRGLPDPWICRGRVTASRIISASFAVVDFHNPHCCSPQHVDPAPTPNQAIFLPSDAHYPCQIPPLQTPNSSSSSQVDYASSAEGRLPEYDTPGFPPRNSMHQRKRRRRTGRRWRILHHTFTLQPHREPEARPTGIPISTSYHWRGAISKTTMLVPEHGYLQHLDLASDFSCFSSAYCDRYYPARLILDARKKRLDCQRHWKLEKINVCAGVGCLLRRKYHSVLRDRTMTLIVQA